MPKVSKKITNAIQGKRKLRQRYECLLEKAKFYFSEQESESKSILNELKRKLVKLRVTPHFKHKMLLKQKAKEIAKATNVHKIFAILEEYLESYINYELLKHLIEKFGDNTLKQKMKKYEDEFEKFASKASIGIFSRITKNDCFCHIQQFKLVNFKLMKDSTSYTLKEACEFKASLAKCSGVFNDSIYFESIATSSSMNLYIRLAVPLNALELIIPALDEQFQAEHSVTPINIDGNSSIGNNFCLKVSS